MLWGVKNIKILTIACVQAKGHSFIHIYCTFISAWIGGYDVSPHGLVGMMFHHPIFFVGLGSKSNK